MTNENNEFYILVSSLKSQVVWTTILEFVPDVLLLAAVVAVVVILI